MIDNKVAKSGLITLDLEQFRVKKEIVSFDLKDYLYMELILKEKDFRDSLKQIDWTTYEDKIIAVHCSTDAIVAHWAYMLVCAHAQGYAARVAHGTREDVVLRLMQENTRAHNWPQYEGKKMLFKGCSDQEMDPSIYATATECALPYADRLMYGEACSFVPVYRRKKTATPVEPTTK